MTARLKQNLGSRETSSFWRLIAHRLYTFNYIFSVLPSHPIKYNPGQTETHFAVRYALERCNRIKTLLEDVFAKEKGTYTSDLMLDWARMILVQCLESESRLGQTERDVMYLFHTARAGLLNLFGPHIEHEDRAFHEALKRVVMENKAKYIDYGNPFEDEKFVVVDEED